MISRRNASRAVLGAVVCLLSASSAVAAESGAPHLDGATLDRVWGVPFIGLLLSIAVVPLIAPRLWRRHHGKVSALWALAFLLPFVAFYGAELALFEFLKVMLLDFVPLMILLLAPYTMSGGVLIGGHIRGTPLLNTGILFAGTVFASIAGTTGASILFIRPLLRANAGRKYNAHVVIFFIFLVSNLGGALTPLGPPLSVGFLNGVDFSWPALHLWQITALVAAILLTAFFVLDAILSERAPQVTPETIGPPLPRPLLKGWLNIFLLVAVPLVILATTFWNTTAGVDVYGVVVGLPDIVRSLTLLGLAAVSWRFTPIANRAGNGFTWTPMLEVATLFASIFVTMVPIIAMLQAGTKGAFAPLLTLLRDVGGEPNNAMYFWLAGGLSSFLDNAPTYLVFFNAAGGDASHLMNHLAATLAAISCGAVFMGANTYIGNAPNFMVKAIAEEAGVNMPSFFGYMIWPALILLPCFALATYLFF